MTKSILLASAALLAFPAVAQAQARVVEDATAADSTQLALDRLVISAGAEKIAIDTPQAVTALDQDDIDQIQATTIGDMLEGIPGVSIQGGASALGQGFNIRGLGTGLADSDSRILMTVDGVTKFFEQYRMGAFFSEPELYKRVEVLRGPASSTLYGAGALAGVVNFTTKDASDFLKDGDRLAVRLKAGTETNAESHVLSGIVAVAPVAGVELLGSYNSRRSDHYEDGHGDEVIPSNAVSDSWLVKARVTIGGNRKHAIWASYQDWISDSTQIYDQAEAFGTTPVRRKVHDKTAVIGYENDFNGSDLFNVEAQASYADSNIHQTETSFLGALEYSEFSYATKQAKFQNRSKFDLGGDWSTFLFLGAQWSDQARRNPRKSLTGVITPGGPTHPEGDMTKYGVFAQAEIVWSDKLTIIPGVRVDWTDLKPGDTLVGGLPVTIPGARRVKDSGVSPKIAASYALTDWFSLFGSVAHTVRMPVLDELYSRTNATATNVSLNLKPEESDNYEAGFSLSFDGLASSRDKLRFKATAFQNDVKNLITRGTATSSYFVNVGESRFKGIEVEAEYGAGGFFARGNLSIIDGKNRLSDTYLNTIPANEYRLTLGYADPVTGLSGGWTGEFSEKQDKVSSIALATPGYAVQNLFLAFKPRIGAAEGFEFRVGVDNVFDRYFQRHLSSLPAEGRTFKVSVANTF
ncbi:TonB-dependent receptor domain-containing protein [Sphingobium boeckii]|uniref:Hemoglobin/transferrin/lactoferrin receptor protein n=1 Tax=Sphingobium boeckii TaxID=1082345 RepID=A0A7W9AGW6_9SPHN|nr:TonB-dependent receptor [Sphingobium boeckii]MBB5685156.1 hemoglobin/transferrin/lactoferrin receptor protein [Sphingobium boeckii]